MAALSAEWPVALASAVGVVAFLYPFLVPSMAVPASEATARTAEAPIVLAVVVAASLLVALLHLDRTRLQGGGASHRVALLGTLVAIDATLRFVPSVAGGSPIFALILLAGAAFGPTFGFLMGSNTLLLSALLTGGIGPWLPYQMLGAGWVGLTAGWLPRSGSPRRRIVLLAMLGGLWGLLYGAILNLSSWPFAAPGLASDAGLYWSPSLSLGETLRHYGAFYLTTSLSHDLFRSLVNVVLVVAVGPPLLRILDRSRRRLVWQPWRPAPEGVSDIRSGASREAGSLVDYLP